MSVLGAHSTSARDWRYFLVGGTKGILSVPAASPYTSAEELITAAQSNPDQLRIASSIQGAVWHIQYLALSRAGDEAQQLVEDQEKFFTWSLYDEGLATLTPEEFGIERP
jgi:hypothetical protein